MAPISILIFTKHFCDDGRSAWWSLMAFESFQKCLVRLIYWFFLFRKHAADLQKVKKIACKRAREIYLPNGLLDYVPEEWGCDYNIEGLAPVLQNIERIRAEKDDGCTDYKRIILFGMTGAGKSYFGNGLLGSQSPSVGRPFQTGSGSQGNNNL